MSSIKVYSIIGLVAILLLGGLFYFVTSYIDKEADIRANKKIAEYTLKLQQEELAYKARLEQEYKENVKVVEKTIEKKIPVYVTDDTCESKLDAINKYITDYYSRKNNE